MEQIKELKEKEEEIKMRIKEFAGFEELKQKEKEIIDEILAEERRLSIETSKLKVEENNYNKLIEQLKKEIDKKEEIKIRLDSGSRAITGWRISLCP